MNRRTILKGGAATLSGMLLANSTLGRRRKAGKLKHFVFVRLGGGPSQMELWDPKPGNKNGGETKGIKTKIAGTQFSENLAGMAEYSDNMAVIRTSSRIGEHMLGTYYVGSGGFGPSPILKHPGMCSVVGWGLNNESNDLPPVVSIGGSMSAGFLGNAYDPYVAGGDVKLAISGSYKSKVVSGDNMRKQYYNVSPYAKSDDFNEEIKHESRSSRLTLGISNKVFDTSTESEATKESYGGRGFGNACLTARRLIMAGVPAVHLQLGGWDNHDGIFANIGPRVQTLDTGISQLVKDLKALGLYDQTLIMIAGEFGRTPRINNTDGRDHYPRNTPVTLISGAIKKGISVGNSGPDGTKQENMVTMGAVSHSVYKMMGISPTGQVMDMAGRPLRYCPSDTGINGIG
ncbi:MAG: DUF1501 domain-containing protein [Lentisphaeraceae bacterium]|nr:DUF1501 domain-containing protein [Lentisphaeraceae bacterium]